MNCTLEKVKRAALSMQRYNWEQGVVAQAFLEAGEGETAILLAIEAAHRQDERGMCAAIGEPFSATDPCAIGEALIYACEETGDPFLQQAKDRLLNWATVEAPRNSKGIVYHVINRPQFWVDSIYMLPPFLARAGYFSEAMKQIDGYWDALFDPARGLLSHQWDDGRKQFLRSAAWGVGNGWAAAGMARVIAMLPPEMDEARKSLMARTNGLIRNVLQYQRHDGMFHDVLDDPSTFPEINCGQMIAYAIYRGVQEEWLDCGLIRAAEHIRTVSQAQVDRFGFVQEIPHNKGGRLASEFFDRCNCRFRRFTGGKSRNLQAADVGKGTVRRAARLCGSSFRMCAARRPLTGPVWPRRDRHSLS